MNSVEALDFAIGKLGAFPDCVETLTALRELIAERRGFEMASLEAALDDYGQEPFAGKTVDAWLR